MAQRLIFKLLRQLIGGRSAIGSNQSNAKKVKLTVYFAGCPIKLNNYVDFPQTCRHFLLDSFEKAVLISVLNYREYCVS